MSKQQEPSLFSKLTVTLAPVVQLGFICFSLALFFILPFPTQKSLIIYGSFFFLQVLLSAYMPGKITQGLLLDDGTREVYNCNGLRCYFTTIALFLLGGYLGLWKLSLAYDNLLPLVSTANLFAWTCWMIIYIRGLNSPKRRPTEGWLNDFWFGVELNPKFLGSDCTLFFDGRPSLLGWEMVTLSYGFKQLELSGTLTTPMILVQIFTFVYMFNFFYTEDHFITTWDVYIEKFGWQLCWGDMAWMPFVCSTCAYFLVTDIHYELPRWAIAVICGMWICGHILERLSTAQKDAFKRDPNQKTFLFGLIKQDYIDAGNNKKILCSGLWGMSRHPNYCGELMNSLSFCLPAGFSHSIFAYAYTFFIWGLLFTRFERDDRKCNLKYGAAWKEYSKRVPYKIIPYVY
jgi:hypothetical protein